MATTIHIPTELLGRVDARAKAENISRNRFIIEALKQALEPTDRWSPEFLVALKGFAEFDELTETADEMLEMILAARTISKGPAL